MITSKLFNFINLEYLDLMADGDTPMKKIMLEMLLAELPVELEKMTALYQKADWKELANVSHKMKSTLAYVGNDNMTMANKTIETIAKTQENTTELRDLLAVLQQNYNSVLPELQSVFNQLD